MSGEFARVRRAFFDREPVRRMLDRKTLKVLNKFGGLVRTTARRSMRPGGPYALDRQQKDAASGAAPAPGGPKKRGRKKKFTVSAPGEAPRTHDKRLLRDLLFYSFDAGAKSVVIGPVRLGRTADQHVPRVHEYGGVIHRRWADSGRPRSDKYEPRPYMRPAHHKYVGRVAQMYRDA